MNLRSLPFALVFLAGLTFTSAGQESGWRDQLKEELPLLGHRNWIVIADAAYPWQTAEGIETVPTGEEQLDVLRIVLEELDRTKHIRPLIFTDAELPYVPEEFAKGIGQYRDELKKMLENRVVQPVLHEQIIGKLDEAAKSYHILLLKTNMTLPYTTIFLQLDCAYWGPQAEEVLRKTMKGH